MSELTEMQLRAFLQFRPDYYTHLGRSREDASRLAQGICRVAGKTGQTVNAYHHLRDLVRIIESAPQGDEIDG